MTNILTHRVTCKKLILATIIIAPIFGFPAHGEETTILNTERGIQSKETAQVSNSVSTSDELSERIKQLVKSLEYPDEVAEDFIRMAMSWEGWQRQPALIGWKERLDSVHQKFEEGKISKKNVAKIEERILGELCKKIREQFKSKDFIFELSDVIRNRRANCVGYSQLTYIAGNAIGLSVRSINVLERFPRQDDDQKEGHIACIIELFDGRFAIADVALFPDFTSNAFTLENHFVKVGNDWELRNKRNPLRIHRRIQLLDRNGLISAIYNNRGIVCDTQGEYDAAIVNYNRAIEIIPEFAMAYNNRGNTYKKKGEHDRAILDFTKAIEIDPGFTQAHLGLGVAYAEKEEYHRAIFHFTKAIKIEPGDAKLYSSRGNIYFATGEYDLAILDFTKAIDLNPGSAPAYFCRGNMYFTQGQYGPAILDYDEAIRIDPDYVGAYINRGVAYQSKGRFDRAMLDYTKALEIDPGEVNAYNNRGLVYQARANYDGAIFEYNRALEIDAGFAQAYYNRGLAYQSKGRFDRAISDYTKAIEIDPKYTMAYRNRGAVHIYQGKYKEARKDLRKAVELSPELREPVKEVSEHYKLNLKLD